MKRFCQNPKSLRFLFLQLIGALISFLFFSPCEVKQAWGVKDCERYICHEAREHVSPQPANSSSNTQACGWTQARLAFRTSKQHPLCHTTHPSLLFSSFSQCHKEQPLFPDHLRHIHSLRLQHATTRQNPPLPPYTCSFVVYSSVLTIILRLYSPNFFHWMTEHSLCNFPLPLLALRQICLCAILITAKAIFMVVFCKNTNLQKR